MRCLGQVQTPVQMVFEDVHWADAATQDLIKFLGRKLQAVRGLIILTAVWRYWGGGQG